MGDVVWLLWCVFLLNGVWCGGGDYGCRGDVGWSGIDWKILFVWYICLVGWGMGCWWEDCCR